MYMYDHMYVRFITSTGVLCNTLSFVAQTNKQLTVRRQGCVLPASPDTAQVV